MATPTIVTSGATSNAAEQEFDYDDVIVTTDSSPIIGDFILCWRHADYYDLTVLQTPTPGSWTLVDELAGADPIDFDGPKVQIWYKWITA